MVTLKDIHMNYEELKMGELRKLFPTIKATSKKAFIEQINIEPIVDIKQSNKVSEIIPKQLLLALYNHIGCTCDDEAYIYFQDVLGVVDYKLQLAINSAYKQIFNKKANHTKCASCVKARVDKLRMYFKNKIDHER